MRRTCPRIAVTMVVAALSGMFLLCGGFIGVPSQAHSSTASTAKAPAVGHLAKHSRPHTPELRQATRTQPDVGTPGGPDVAATAATGHQIILAGADPIRVRATRGHAGATPIVESRGPPA